MKTDKSLLKHEKHKHLDPLIQELVHARQAQKFTQQQLADLSGVSRRTIVLIEAGGDCTLSTLRRITTALNLQMNLLTPRWPNLDDVLRENEQLFSSSRSN